MVKSIAEGTKRGIVGTLILMALNTGDKYGYEIIKEIESKSNGEYSIKQPSLYSALKRMETAGHVSSYWKDSEIGGRRHYYKILDSGKEKLSKASFQWPENTDFVNNIFDGKEESSSEKIHTGSKSVNSSSDKKVKTDSSTNPIAYTISKPTLINDEVVYPKPNPNQTDMFSVINTDDKRKNKLDKVLESKENKTGDSNIFYSSSNSSTSTSFENEFEKLRSRIKSENFNLSSSNEFTIKNDTGNSNENKQNFEDSFIARNYSKKMDRKFDQPSANATVNDYTDKSSMQNVELQSKETIKSKNDEVVNTIINSYDDQESKQEDIDYSSILGDLAADNINQNTNQSMENNNHGAGSELPRIKDTISSMFRSTGNNKNIENRIDKQEYDYKKDTPHSSKPIMNSQKRKEYFNSIFNKIYSDVKLHEHVKQEKDDHEVVTRYVSLNKLNAANSFIIFILMIVQLVSAHVLITKHLGANVISNTSFLSAMGASFSIFLFYLLKMTINPNKKTALNIDLKNKLFNNLILIVIISIFVYSFNLIIGMNPQNINNFAGSLVLPIILSLNLLIYPITKLILLTRKKYYV